MSVVDRRVDDRLSIFAIDFDQHYVACMVIRSGIGGDFNDNRWVPGSAPLPLNQPDKAYLIGQPEYRYG